jgi:hypothetical protein
MTLENLRPVDPALSLLDQMNAIADGAFGASVTIPTPFAAITRAEQAVAELAAGLCQCGHSEGAHRPRMRGTRLARGCGVCPGECPGYRPDTDETRALREQLREQQKRGWRS